MKLILPSGTTGFWNDRNEWVCTGSQMGRRNVLPEDTQAGCKLHLTKLPLIDGCYDRAGAYWGAPSNLWIAYTAHHVYSPVQCETQLIPSLMVFVRADNREVAKQLVRKELPKARFYR